MYRDDQREHEYRSAGGGSPRYGNRDGKTVRWRILMCQVEQMVKREAAKRWSATEIINYPRFEFQRPIDLPQEEEHKEVEKGQEEEREPNQTRKRNKEEEGDSGGKETTRPKCVFLFLAYCDSNGLERS